MTLSMIILLMLSLSIAPGREIDKKLANYGWKFLKCTDIDLFTVFIMFGCVAKRN